MPMKQTGRKIYTTMQGKQVDMDLLRQKNELTPAVGNARVNARGDELGPGGKIIKTREQVMSEYKKGAPGVPDETVEKRNTTNEQAESTDPLTVDGEDWVEDDDGNFVQKGE